MVSTDYSSRRPNIIFILADDLGWGDLSIYGQKNYQTPHLDEFAKQGVRFINAYSASPVCTPTRIAFFTGRYPGRLTIGNHEPLINHKQIGDTVGLPPAHPTVASLLQAHGYDTALVGKWHCGYPPKYGPLKNGFNEFWGNLSGAIDYFRHVDPDGEPDLWEAEMPIIQIGYVTDLFTQRAVEFIKRPRNRPFYLSLHYTAPHWPWEGPDEVELSQQLRGKDSLKNWINTGTAESYAAVVQNMDAGIGRVLLALDEAELENTLVIFASDNGGEKYSDFGAFQGKKGELYEGGIRVPAICRWFGVIPSDQISDQVTITMDITATILAAAGVDPHPGYPLDGENLLPLLTGEIASQDRTLFWRYQGLDVPALPPPIQQSAARNGDWKYLRLGDQEHLFNLSEDAAEQTDLKAVNVAVFEQLRAEFQRWQEELEPYPA